MPTAASLRVPPPLDGIEFQRIVLDALRQRWRNTELEIIGRPGQRQDGVDIYGPDDVQRMVGVQCKCVQKLDVTLIAAEAKSAEAFEPELESYFIATSLPTDAALQKEVRKLSAERRTAGSFPVGILFWDALVVDLANDLGAFRKHFPFFAPAAVGERAPGSRALALLDLAYFASNVRVYLDLVFGEIGWMVSDPYTIARLSADVEACATVLLEGGERERLVKLAQDLESMSLRIALGRAAPGESWEDVSGIATRIEALVATMQNRLETKELATYSVGRALALWHSHAVDSPNGKAVSAELIFDLVKASVAAGLSNGFRSAVKELESEYRADKSVAVVKIPDRLYNAARKELYEAAMGIAQK